MYYNLTTITTPVDLLLYINSITHYLFGPLVVLGFFVITLVSMKNFETEKSFAASTFLTALLCFFFFIIGLTSMQHVMLASIAFISSLFFLKYGEGGS
jgi:hypothetical protein